MLYFLTLGTLLGLSAGFAPGPLLTLVITETLRHDIKSGVKVALAPILTDFPIIVLTLFFLSKLSGFHNILGLISIAGGLFISTMAYESVRTRGMALDSKRSVSNSLTKGILANALNPHPYLFWFSVGAPTMVAAMQKNIFALLAFIVSFYVFLLGSKILLAVLTGKSKSFLTGKGYIYIMRFLGVALGVLAIVLIYNGLKLMQVIRA
ncbi:putative threonine efflux protein [uncultured Desulfatiglans sp.]|uniref:Putative threonine efflux protein n=1 Tax=Uncultured Desulfatiglans sp. TaxID=1748965 RepID=A0A653A4D9_UNCDX|nr:putative threonine efflux protein [uncultured Desulfatiglans sp.]